MKMKENMEWIFLFLLGIILDLCTLITSKTASACYGSQSCSFIDMECSPGTFIEILSAYYLFSRIDVCKGQNIENIPCTRQNELDCCNPKNGHSRTNFTTRDRATLEKICSGKQNCKNKYQANRISGSDNEISSLVEVTYDCNTKNSQDSSTDKASPPADAYTDPTALAADSASNIAAIVVPILIVLVIAILAAGCIFYWRRKQEKEGGKSESLPSPHQNPGYFTTDKSIALPSEHHDSEAPIESTYHCIDPNCIPDQLPFPADTADPEGDYHMIDPYKMDGEAPATHDYLILEQEGQPTSEYHLTNAANDDYNMLNLKAKNVVHDPNYQRLDQKFKATLPKESENYSSTIGEAIKSNEAQAKVQ